MQDSTISNNNDIHFKQIVKNVRREYVQARPVAACPDSDTLVEYAYGGLSDSDEEKVSHHLTSCDRCQMICHRLHADESIWNNMLEETPEAALYAALGRHGREMVNAQMKARNNDQASSAGSFVSRIRDEMIAWVTPLWQPLYAGEPITAMDLEEQNTSFEMDFGEYINLSCHWHEEKDRQACVELSWQANLLQPSRLWARFIDSEKSTILTEILLGNELEGKICIPGERLNFNPTSDKWAIAIVVEED